MFCLKNKSHTEKSFNVAQYLVVYWMFGSSRP